jgi:RNA polymerase sigma-70 factor (sigma-E family)
MHLQFGTAGREEVAMTEGDFEAFATEHTAALLRLAYLLCRDSGRAEDLVQDALERALRQWRRDGPPDAPLAYVRRVVVNCYLGWRRRRASGELVGVPDLAEPSAADGSDERAARDLTWRLLGTLEPRQRAVLVLRYYLALPDHEIAAHLGCADATVRSLASRAFAVLRTDPQLAELAPEHTNTEA